MSVQNTHEMEWQMAKNSLTERNKHMFNNRLISDVNFLVQDPKSGEMRTLPAHRYILSISSPVFFVMFYGTMPESSDPIVIPDCDSESFLELLRFVYCDEVNLNERNVSLILYISKKYMIPSLLGRCVEFMRENLSAKTVFTILPGVHISGDASLLKKCWEKVDEKTIEAINSEAFLNISKELLCFLLKRDTLNASEIDIFHAVDEWCENQCKNQQVEVNEKEKKRILGDASYLIRFPLMSQSEFAFLVNNSGLLATEDVSNIFLHFNNALGPALKFSQTKRAWSNAKESWQLVFHNDTDGSTLAGSKASLKAAVSSGARVRVFIESFLDGCVTTTKRYSTEADNLSIYGGHVFAQLLQNVSKASWDGFQDDAYWWWMIASTEGSVHAISCYVGANTLRADEHPRARIKWFVKPMLSPAVYSNDKEGMTVAGKLEDLRSHVKNGCEIVGLNSKVFAFPAQTVTIQSDAAGHVAGQNVDHVGQVMFPDQLKFQSNPYWCFTIVTTQGMRDMSRWTVGTHQSRGHTGDEMATEWFADTRWKHVYAHDANGIRTAGSRGALVKAIIAGHRVRFQIVDRNFFTAEADNLTIRNGHVTAQALKNLSKTNLSKFEDDVFWSWLIISTSGSTRVTRYDVGDSKHRGDSTGAFKINWFVDTRAWHPVLSHDKDGVILAGSREELISAVQDGASVRCVQGNSATYFCFQAQNLEISPDEQHVAAQTLNRVATEEAPVSDEMKFQTNAHWFFTVVSTTGKRDISRWTVGKHEDRGHSSDRVATKWFVNH